MKLNVSFVAVLFLLIGGCSFAPGYNTPVEVPPGITIIPITSEVIAEQLAKSGQQNNLPLPSDTLPKSVSPGEYRIGPHDVLNIIIWDYPGLDAPVGEFGETRSAGYLVAADGTIFFPFVGRVNVAGKTAAEVRWMLAEKLKSTILNAQIDVQVADFRSRKIFISGEVNSPGQKPISDTPITILDAISMAEGSTENADLGRIILARSNSTYFIDMTAFYKSGDLSQNVTLQHKDVINIPDRSARKVYVIGEVISQTSLIMDNQPLTLTEAINDATVSGVNPVTSRPGRIYVIRGNPNNINIYHLDANRPSALILGDNFLLQPRDVVYVDTASVTRWNRVISQILPSAAFLFSSYGTVGTP